MDRISSVLKKYISERIPKKATNIFWQLFNGVEAMFVNLEYRLDITKRERNMLTAQNLASLRNLASQNGFEPILKVPAKGILNIAIDPKLFNRVGFPLFIPPYSIFTNKSTGITYYYNSDKSLRVSTSIVNIPVIEGTIKQVSFTGTGAYLDRFYLTDDNISENSMTIEIDGIQYTEVKSFFDNSGLNDDKQFLLKFSNNIQNPIIVYIKGAYLNAAINVNYRLSSGEIGNIVGINEFETQSILNNIGSIIDIDDKEMTIINQSGFEFGSNGTDENSLRAAIGYNHGKNLLFDNISYSNFVGKYSTLLIQKIINSDTEKTINNIYLSKKQSLNIDSTTPSDYIDKYKAIILTKSYLLSQAEKLSLSKIIEEYEYALSSHNIFDAKTCNFAFQISMTNNAEVIAYTDMINNMLYVEFSKFFYIKNHIINIENLFETFMQTNNIKFEYMIFNQLIEDRKIKEKIDLTTAYIIKHDEYLPLLNGNFPICDSSFNSVNLFFDINIVSNI